MTDLNAVTKEDMRLKKQLLSCDNVSFQLGEKRCKGFPDGYNPITEISPVGSGAKLIKKCGISSKGAMLTVKLTEYNDFPALSYSADIVNRGKVETEKLEAFAVTGTLLGSNAKISFANGDTRDESGFTRSQCELNSTCVVLSPVSCRGSEGASPFVILTFDEYSVLLAVGWPGKWRLVLKTVSNGVEFNLSQARLSSVIFPFETFRTPSVTALFWYGDNTRGINMWRRFYFAHICPKEADGKTVKPRLFLHTFEIGGKSEFCGITAENQLAAIDKYTDRGLKPDCWWIDAGWYPCNDNWVNTGDWHPNPDNLPDGFAPIAEKCHSKGIELLLWFEPERVVEGSRFEYLHPEWLLYAHNEDGSIDKNRLVNLANPDCLSFVTDMLDGIIKAGGIDIYRQDFNFTPDKFWEQNEAENRIGSLENLHIQGILRLFDELKLRNPSLMFDICASGGTRNEMEFLQRAVPLQYTDVGLGNPVLRQKQYREMFSFVPYFRTHSYESKKTARKGKAVDEYTYLCALTPAVTSMIEFDDAESRFETGRLMHPIWRRAAEIEICGDYYPLGGQDGWYAVQFHNPKTDSGFIEVIRNADAKDTHFTVYPFVKDNLTYIFTNALSGEQKRASAKGLKSGLAFYSPGRRGELWFYSTEQKSNI